MSSRLLVGLTKRPSFITILTGAGISAESGVPTFRDANGLWCNHLLEDVACPEAYERDPALVQQFYNERRRNILLDSVKPNPAHVAVARLQKEMKNVFLVTQNVDNLHERAGSTNVVHMHGELLKVRCTRTGKVFDWVKDILLGEDRCSCCQAVGTLRPHIVWFGEVPFCMDTICDALGRTDLFISCGTSGNVYPAAGFVRQVKDSACMNGEDDVMAVEVNAEPGSNAVGFDLHLYGSASELMPKVVEEILALK